MSDAIRIKDMCIVGDEACGQVLDYGSTIKFSSKRVVFQYSHNTGELWANSMTRIDVGEYGVWSIKYCIGAVSETELHYFVQRLRAESEKPMRSRK